MSNLSERLQFGKIRVQVSLNLVDDFSKMLQKLYKKVLNTVQLPQQKNNPECLRRCIQMLSLLTEKSM